MREYYHRAIAKLKGWWRVILNIPTAIRWKNDEDMGRKEMLTIVKRIAQSDYYQKHAEKQPCGCYAIGKYYTSYLYDCRTHMQWLWGYTEND